MMTDRFGTGHRYNDLLSWAFTAKSKQRVFDFGEVFTPRALVQAMLDLVRAEAERIDARFLEQACGSGNFLIPILHRKLSTVEGRYGKSDFEKRTRLCLR